MARTRATARQKTVPLRARWVKLQLDHAEFASTVRLHMDRDGKLHLEENSHVVSMVIDQLIEKPTMVAIQNATLLFGAFPRSQELFNDVTCGSNVIPADEESSVDDDFQVTPGSFITPLTKLFHAFPHPDKIASFSSLVEMMLLKGAFYQTTFGRIVTLVSQHLDIYDIAPRSPEEAEKELPYVTVPKPEKNIYKLFLTIDGSCGCFINMCTNVHYQTIEPIWLALGLYEVEEFKNGTVLITRTPTREEVRKDAFLKEVYYDDELPEAKRAKVGEEGAVPVATVVVDDGGEKKPKDEPNPEALLYGDGEPKDEPNPEAILFGEAK